MNKRLRNSVVIVSAFAMVTVFGSSESWHKPNVASSQQPDAGQQSQDETELSRDTEKLEEKTLAYILETLGEVEFRRADGVELTMREQPVLRWNNPVSGSIDAGLFVWLHNDRPQVISKFYLNKRYRSFGEDHIPMSDQPLKMRGRGTLTFDPSESEWVALDDVRPAPTAASRQSQARILARQFGVVDWYGIPKVTRWELRLLPKPIYRYESESAKIRDGFLFAFVQGVNPECLLQFEVRDDGPSSKWYVRPIRCSWYKLEVTRNDQDIQTFERLEDFRTPALFHRWIRLRPFPFEE